ncbi:MAG: hypothetical protein V7L05_19100 [Nostoc sp.]|uniref:hypothetical protein n=1 Tax=Nostoc sp. TaxID=1180 RepID=UPI002FF75DDB
MSPRKANKTSEYTVTRIAYSVGETPLELVKLATVLGELRSELWNKYGSLQAWGVDKNTIIKSIRKKALDEISIRKGGKVTLVNAAYTLQVDHRNGTLLGKRLGDQFFTFDGVVLQADYNAGNCIKYRGDDSVITRFMKKEEVHRILVERTRSFLAELGHSLESAVSMGWLDQKHLLQGKSSRRRRQGLDTVSSDN